MSDHIPDTGKMPPDLLRAFLATCHAAQDLKMGYTDGAIRAALAAVAPLIAAQERERCARVADREADTQRIVRGRQTEDWEYLQKQDAKTDVAENIAAAIRALGDAT